MKFIYTILFLMIVSGCATENYQTLVNKDPHAVFSQGQFNDEWLIDIKGQTLDTHWSMSLIKEESNFLIVASHNDLSKSDNPAWKIKSSKQIRLLHDDETFSAGTCEINGDPQPNIVAIVKYEPDNQWFTDVRYAVSFDENRNKFTEIPIENMRCINEGYGEGD